MSMRVCVVCGVVVVDGVDVTGVGVVDIGVTSCAGADGVGGVVVDVCVDDVGDCVGVVGVVNYDCIGAGVATCDDGDAVEVVVHADNIIVGVGMYCRMRVGCGFDVCDAAVIMASECGSIGVSGIGIDNGVGVGGVVVVVVAVCWGSDVGVVVVTGSAVVGVSVDGTCGVVDDDDGEFGVVLCVVCCMCCRR